MFVLGRFLAFWYSVSPLAQSAKCTNTCQFNGIEWPNSEDAAMTTEQVTNLPETLAMLTLIATLLFIKRRKPQLPIDSWLVALGLLFLSHLSWYFARRSGPWHYATHTIRLTFDLAAGAILLRFTGRPFSETPRQSLIVTCNLIPILAVEALYGADIAQPYPYIECCIIGTVVCAWVAFHLRRGFLIPILQTLVFSSVATFAFYGNYRAAAYWCLGSVYLAAACHIWPRMRDTTMGRSTVVVSLLLWSASFCVHPWALYNDSYRQAAEQIWAMQKFSSASACSLHCWRAKCGRTSVSHFATN
jgi:hypothetical protein